MRALMLSLVLLTACGEKTPPEAAAEAAATAEEAAEAAAAAAEPEPEPEPEEPAEPPPPPSNVDFNMTIGFADGSSKSGHVRYLEVSTDGTGDAGYTDEASKLKMYGSKDGTEREIKFTDIKSATIKPGSIPGDVSCTYSSDWTPWMYDCTIKTKTSITVEDGSVWAAEVPRRKWRVTFDDESTVEFWLYNYSAREQDDTAVSLETTNPENYDLYTKLQQQLREDVKSNAIVTSISID